ncbi:MAG: VOC family protein [Mesorhizobium sp.]|nr:VOC family protein [Mesorhizobium sp.]
MTTYTAIEPPRIYPTFRFRDAAATIDWLRDAFGFTVKARYEDDKGVVGHAELALGSSIIMCGQAQEDEYGTIVGQPGYQGGKSLYIAVDDVDALFEQVRKAGAAIEQGLTDRDYGSREFICRDPEGNVWCFGTYWPKAHEG